MRSSLWFLIIFALIAVGFTLLEPISFKQTVGLICIMATAPTADYYRNSRKNR